MGFPRTPSPPHLYSQELQLKLYQAFIFSIPILFSIILFLLFYLFYLKKRCATTSSSSATLPQSSNQVLLVSSSSASGFKGILKDKLPVILFDEGAMARETLCCVCLGEFKVKEELHLLPPCKHFFHTDCIRHWLHSNSTCPLCRCSVIISQKSSNSGPHAIRPNDENVNQSTRVVSVEQQEQPSMVELSMENCTREQQIVTGEGSSRSGNSLGIDNGLNLHTESVVINILTHGT